MGAVYLAQDTRLEREVALKVLHREAAGDPDRRRRFVQEARAASALNHPNILTVYEIGQLGDVHFIATELIRGKTLRERLHAGALPVAEAVDIAAQVATALCAAHEAGIVHRDVKPENVMIRDDGIVKVLDFGLAKLAEAQPVEPEAETALGRLTRAGTLLGTVAYMSPEQARGRELDARSDVFSLGVVLYELLTGRPPFGGETASHIIVAILEREPAPLAESRGVLPSGLEAIVGRALAKKRSERYQTASALLQELQALRKRLESLAGAEAPPPPPSARRSGVPAVDSGERRNAIAVLPFANMSAEADNEYFCDGLAEELLNALSRIPGLKVAARTSAFSFKGRSTSVSEIGRSLGVGTVLQGSVRKAGRRLRVSVQLIDAVQGFQMWSERYDRELADVFEVQDEIALRVVEALRHRLLAAGELPAPKRGTADVLAYELYLKGRFCWSQRTPGSLRQAAEFYGQAIARDPGYALAHAGLAECYALYSWLSVTPPHATMPKAKQAAERALELDESLAEAHAALGVYLSFYAWDQPASERALLRAIELNPGYATAHHWLGNIPLLAMGRHDESLAALERARVLEPLSPIIGADLGVTLLHARRYDDAVARFRATLELDPKFYVARYHLGATCHAQGRMDAAIAEYQAALQAEDDPWVKALLARSLAAASRADEASRLRDRLHAEAERRYVPNVALAVADAALGELDRAFAWLEKDLEERSLYPPFYAVDPVFDEVRGDLRFAALVARIEAARL